MNRQSKKRKFSQFLSLPKRSEGITDVETIPVKEEIKLSTRNAQPAQLDTQLDEMEEESISAYKSYMLTLISDNENAKLKLCIQKLTEIIKENLSENDNAEDTVESILKQIIDNPIDEEYAIIEAVAHNNIEAVKILIDSGADVDLNKYYCNTPLAMAAWGSKTQGKKSLDTFGHDVKFVDETARLKDGVTNNDNDLKNEALVVYLLSCNANPNALDDGKQTPLHNAANRGNVSAVRPLLCCKNIIVDAADVNLMTPLHIACDMVWPDVCKLLINAKASVTFNDKWNNTPLHYAAKRGNCQIIELLLQALEHNQNDLDAVNILINAKNSDQNTPLTLAILNDSEEAVQLLINRGANVYVRLKNLSSTLHLASSQGNIEILDILLKNNTNLEWKNADYETPLHVACASNKVKTVEFLLSKNANIEARDKHGRTPFLTCFQATPCESNLKIIQILVERGASTNTADRIDNTAVIMGCTTNNIPALEYILNFDKCKELVDRVDRDCNSPLHVAAKNGNIDAFKCMIKHGASLDAKNDYELGPLHSAVSFGQFSIVRYILEREDSLRLTREKTGEADTPLHLACAFGFDDVVKLLLSVSLDVLETKNVNYEKPLSLAAANGHKRIVEILLDHGAKIQSEDDSKPALLEACTNGHVDVFKFLLKKGARLDVLDYKGRNCLDIAIDENKKDIALIIVKHDDWKKVVMCTRITSTSNRSTPTRELIAKMPDVAKVVLDKCVTSTDDSVTGERKTTYEYELIDDVYSNWTQDRRQDSVACVLKPLDKRKGNETSSTFDEHGRLRPEANLYTKNFEEIKKNHPLMIMVSQDNEELLGHSLVLTLVDHKWTSYVRYLYYSGLLLYVIFLSFLTDFAINSTPHYNFAEEFQTLPNDFCYNETLTTIHMDDIPTLDKRIRFSQYMALILSVINGMKELSQWYYRGKEYFAVQNIIEGFLYICTLIFVIDWNSCSRLYGYRVPEQWLFGVTAAFFGWINLILMVRQFPLLGIYVVMFTDVLRTFSKFFVVFFLFIVAFAVAFFMLFQNQAPFETMPRTIIKTLVMMVGEFDYNAMFYSTNTDHGDKAYKVASQTVFFIFALIITILITNLLTGLAVQDIKEVQNKAILQRLAMKVELVLEIEYIAMEFIRRRFMIGRKTVTSREENWFLKRIFRSIFTKTEVEAEDVDAIPNLYENATFDKNKQNDADDVVEQIDHLKQSVAEVKLQQDQATKLLKAIASRFDVNILD